MRVYVITDNCNGPFIRDVTANKDKALTVWLEVVALRMIGIDKWWKNPVDFARSLRGYETDMEFHEDYIARVAKEGIHMLFFDIDDPSPGYEPGVADEIIDSMREELEDTIPVAKMDKCVVTLRRLKPYAELCTNDRELLPLLELQMSMNIVRYGIDNIEDGISLFLKNYPIDTRRDFSISAVCSKVDKIETLKRYKVTLEILTHLRDLCSKDYSTFSNFPISSYYFYHAKDVFAASDMFHKEYKIVNKSDFSVKTEEVKDDEGTNDEGTNN